LIRVGIAVVFFRDAFLVGTRPLHAPLGGYSEFPGGKCEPGEEAAGTAVRECQEETGLRVEPVRVIDIAQHAYPDGSVELHFWLCTPVDAQPRIDPASNFRWVARLELEELEFPPANKPLIRNLIGRGV